MILTTRAENGGHVWANVGEPQLWLLSKVLLVREKDVKVEVIGNDFDDVNNDERCTVLETAKVLAFDRLQLDDWNDALRMSGELNEASLLQLLRRRFQRNTIFTFLGDVLVSINPYKDVGALTAIGIPSEEELEQSEKEGAIVPHLYVVSERAHRYMLTHGPRGTPQSILINGESGSGKTEAAKCIMKCLAQRSFAKRQVLKKQASAGLNNNLKRMGLFGASQLENRGVALLTSRGRGKGATKVADLTAKADLDGSEDVEDAGSKVERSFIVANPMLETFGNAKTVNNHNSSRFGKFVKIEYDDEGCIVGTSTRAFFLEKSRLVRRALGERNFHSFYQLLNAHRLKHELLSDGSFQELEAYEASPPTLLKETSQVDNRRATDDDEALEDEDVEVDDVFNEDLAAFDATNKSMQAMGLDDDECRKIWKMVSVILAIGDLQFDLKATAEKTDNLERAYVSRNLDVVANLLNVDPHVLELALCQRSVRAGKRGSITYSPQSPAKARASMEGLAKALYNCLFTWLVERVNEASREATASVQKSRRKEPLFIGVLDIFGFEVLRTNSFEQLCINFANEVMQHFFDQHVFELERNIYNEEGVDSSKFVFRDNTPIINLLSGKPSGIFRVLDEQGMMGDAATDANFLQKLDVAHKASTDIYKSRPILHRDGLFEVKHFAGSVIYDVSEFIAKNKDILEPDLVDMVTGFASRAPEEGISRFIGQMYIDVHGEKDPTASLYKQETTNRKLTTLETVSGRFRIQMQDLSDILSATEQNFIRCVKPNRVKLPDRWDAPLVLNQLKYLSVMEMVRIRTEGFPVRLPFPDLVSKFPELLLPTEFSWYPGTNDKRACETLLRAALGEDSEHKWWVSGATKCFLRDGVLERLMNMVRDLKVRAAVKVQSLARMFIVRRRFLRKRVAAIKIQRWFMQYCKTKPPSTAECATKIQAAVRSLLARREAARRLRSIILIQRFRRNVRKERRARRLRKIVEIQAWWRKINCQRIFWKFKLNLSRFQAQIRGLLVRLRYRKVLESREPWKEFLSPNEAVVLTSLVVKTSDVHGVRTFTKGLGSVVGGMFSSKKHRQLIFTTGPGSNELDPQSAPRLFYVDPVSRSWKGEVPYDTGLTCGLTTGDKDFLIYSKQNDDKQDKTPIWTFTDLLGPAVCWIRSIRRNVSVLELVRDHQPAEFHTRVPPSHKGPLLMRQLIGPKKYNDLYFTLVGTDLWWIHTPGQTTPSGGVNLTAQCNVRVIENPRQLPGVPNYAFWLDTPCRVKPLKFRTNDQNTMRTWVTALERAIKKCRDDEATKNDPVALADRVYQSGCALFDARNFLGAKIKFKDSLDIVRGKGNGRVEAKQIEFDSLEHRARCNFVLGLYEKALEDANNALVVKPGNESCMRTKAAALEKLNRFQESIDEYDRLIALAPWATDLKTLREKALSTMEMMRGKNSNSGGSSAASALSKPKAPAIARNPSREFLREGSRSGLLSLPVDATSPTNAISTDKKFKGFTLVNKRKMEDDETRLAPKPPIGKKPPPSIPPPRSASQATLSGLAPPAIPSSRPSAPFPKEPTPPKPAPPAAARTVPVASVIRTSEVQHPISSRTFETVRESSLSQNGTQNRPSPSVSPTEAQAPAPPSHAQEMSLSPSPPPPPTKKPAAARLLRATSASTDTAVASSTTPSASPATSPSMGPSKRPVQQGKILALDADSGVKSLSGEKDTPAVANVKKLKQRQSSGSGNLAFAKAIAEYKPAAGMEESDLAFKKGDEILVLHKFKDGWWKGSLNGKQGLFPSTYVQAIDIRDVKGIAGTMAAKPPTTTAHSPLAVEEDKDYEQL